MENQIIIDMKHVIKTLSAAAFLLLSVSLSAQKTSDPQGSIAYCLPSTVINLEVEALREDFYAGPYAKYAEKYLGIKVRQKDETTYQLLQINMTPYVEADHSERYALSVEKGKIDASFLKLSSAGLVSFSDAVAGGETHVHQVISRTKDYLQI